MIVLFELSYYYIKSLKHNIIIYFYLLCYLVVALEILRGNQHLVRGEDYYSPWKPLEQVQPLVVLKQRYYHYHFDRDRL